VDHGLCLAAAVTERSERGLLRLGGGSWLQTAARGEGRARHVGLVECLCSGCLDRRACVHRLLPRSGGSVGHLHDNAVAVEVGLDLGGGSLSGRHVDCWGFWCCEAEVV